MSGREILKYIGPGLLVTVGFIDPGNWAANLAAGASCGYTLLWMVTLSTAMLIILQHNVAHLGIATGLCLAEGIGQEMAPWVRGPVLASAVLACMATGFAELLGGALGLRMLFHLPLTVGVALMAAFVFVMLFGNSYKRLEHWIMAFVGLIGLAFLFEIALVKLDWPSAAVGWVTPAVPPGAMVIVMSVLGAVVMPHNLFLHSEIVQSRTFNLEDDVIIRRQLKYEFVDTLFSMLVGWAINSAMILVAAATFFAAKVSVTELEQAHEMLQPLLGNAAAVAFAVALVLAGAASSVTAAMAGGTVMAGWRREPYDIHRGPTRVGVAVTILGAALAVLFVHDTLKALVFSQMVLSIQLPVTIFSQIYLTSSTRVMGKHANSRALTATLLVTGGVVSVLNVMLLVSIISSYLAR